MTDLTTLLADLEKLKSAYRSGAREVAYGDKRISYRDDAEMRAAIAGIEAELAAAQGARPVRNIVVRSDKGW